MYLFHLISIDLQSSRSFNTHTLQSLHRARLEIMYLLKICFGANLSSALHLPGLKIKAT
jgi:hypothetical protein